MKILLFILLVFSLFAEITKGSDPIYAIRLNNSAAVQYCNLPELVAESLTIEFASTITGMKISFSEGYIAGEDLLVYTGALTQNWSPTTGSLVLTGGSSTQDYVSAIRTITYKNSKSVPTLGVRRITISLDDIDYLPATGHFYRFVSRPGISWTTARDEAASNAMMYYGLRGYLATVTSQAENDFIKLKTKGVGWIGASDAAIEDEWRWVTGPEGLEDGGKGRLFWKGTGAQYAAGLAGTGPVLGQYTNWNSIEPNDFGDNNISHQEDYGHITFFPSNPAASYKWNDLPNAGSTGDYASAGYLIEFGGYPGDPVLSLSATLDLQVNTIFFKTGTIAAVCEGDSVTLNQQDKSPFPATYSWTPSISLSNAFVANPVASPTITTSYTVKGIRGVCEDSAHYIVPVNPGPVSMLKAEENRCKGTNVTLDPGNHQSYSWSNGATTRTITIDIAGEYTVTLTSDKGCKATSSSKVIIHEFPTLDFSKLDTLICGNPRATTVNINTNATSFSLISADSKATLSGLNVSAPFDGVYPMVFKASIYPSCALEKNFNLAFFKTPLVDFTVNAKKCSGYNLDVSYVGDADTLVSNFKWEFGGEVIANGVDVNSLIVPLGINRSQRDLSLTVTQDGCSNSYIQPNILVIPNLDLKIVKNLGCEPFSAEFIATNTEVVNYDWEFGDGTPVQRKDNHPFHLYQAPGFYDVKLKVTTIVTSGTGCTNEVKIDSMVHVAPIPDVAFSLSPEECLNPGINAISYTGLIGTDKDNYYWELKQFDPSEIIKDPAQTKGPFRFDLKTKPQVNLGLQVVSEFGCKSALKSITLKRKPDFSIVSDVVAGCIPFNPTLSGKINFNDQIDQVDFGWDFGDGLTGTGSPVSHIYDVPDKKFTITLTGKSSITGCSDIKVGNDYLQTFPKPVAAFNMDNTIVYNDKPTVNFTNASAGANSWLWHFGDDSTSVRQNPAHNYLVTGYRTVLLEAFNEFGCMDTVTHQVLVAFDRIFPPNGFSPNAPKSVDRVFLLNSVGITPEGYHFTVLSRWNDLIFEARDEIKGWDGRMKNGNWAPAGTYLWILNFTDFLGRKHRQSGSVTLVY